MIDGVLTAPASVFPQVPAGGDEVTAPRLDKTKTGPLEAPSSSHKDAVDQSLCQVWLLQIRPPSTQPLILSEVPDNVALPE